MCNMTAYQTSENGCGKFHAGFLKKSSVFPLKDILTEEEYKGRNIIFCGHSMGGAVATISTILALQFQKERERLFGKDEKTRIIRCFTFGAPLVGDSKLELVRKLILRYAMLISSLFEYKW